MKLYIANATKQDHDFLYRMGFDPQADRQGAPRVRLLPIKKGSQVAIEGNKEELEAVIGQHRIYGIVDVKEFEKMPKFSGLVYSVGSPINVDRIYHALDHHDEVIDENAQEARENSTAATNAMIEDHARNANASVTETSFELKELQRDQTDESRKVDVLIKTDKRGDKKPNRKVGRPRAH